jgi:hypothetical protein
MRLCKQARIAQKKKKTEIAGKFPKDDDFEKMFDQDIYEKIPSGILNPWTKCISKGSKQTIHSLGR